MVRKIGLTFLKSLFVIVFSIAIAECTLRLEPVKNYIEGVRENYTDFIPSQLGIELKTNIKFKIADLYSDSNVEKKTSIFSLPKSSFRYDPIPPYIFTKWKPGTPFFEKIHAIKKNEITQQNIYDVQYGFDNLRRRQTVDDFSENEIKSSRTPIALIGCSFVFGMGVNDSETMPSHLQKELGSKFKVYNLGIISGAVNDFLDDISSARRLQDMTNNNGVAVYVYYPIHRERTFCLTDCYRDEWRRQLYLNKSNWVVNENFESEKTGTIKDSRSELENYFRTFIFNSEIGKLIKFFHSADLQKYKKEYLNYIKALEKKYNDRNMHFVLYLLDKEEAPWSDEDINSIKESGINYIYFKRDKTIVNISKMGLIKEDDHFNSFGNYYHAIRIFEGLKELQLLGNTPAKSRN